MSTTTGQENVTHISRKYLPKVKCTVDHARSVASAGAADTTVEETKQYIDKLRQDVLGRIRMEIKLLMLRVAKKEGMMYDKTARVGKFNKIGLSWQQDRSIGNCKILFVVLYGWFDINLGWAKNIEDSLMQNMNIQYDEVGSGKRGDIGCIEWLVNHCKRELVKLINARSSITHGKNITITRERGTDNAENRFKKRQKGAFYADFVKDGSPILSPSTPAAHSDGEESAEFNDDDVAEIDNDDGTNFDGAGADFDGDETDDDEDIVEVVEVKKTESEREMQREMTRMAEEIRKEDAERKKDRRTVVIDAARKVITSATRVAAKKVAAKRGAEDPPPNQYERKRLRKVWRNTRKLNELNLLKPDEKEAFEKTLAPDDTSSDESDGDSDDSEEEIVQIVQKKVEGGAVCLKVRWSTGEMTWASEANVKLDEPEMLERFYEASVMSPLSSPSKKGRGDLDIVEKRGACSGEHSLCDGFRIEEDPRYWNEGNSFYDVKCGKCEGESRPTSKEPSYCCRQWSTQGCIELRCCACFSNMLTTEGAGGRRTRRRPVTTV